MMGKWGFEAVSFEVHLCKALFFPEDPCEHEVASGYKTNTKGGSPQTAWVKGEPKKLKTWLKDNGGAFKLFCKVPLDIFSPNPVLKQRSKVVESGV